MTELSLACNKIGDEGAIAIGKALEVNKVVRSLTLGSNNIGDRGAFAIGKALEVNKVLWYLNLTNNNIGRAAKGILAQVLSNVALGSGRLSVLPPVHVVMEEGYV